MKTHGKIFTYLLTLALLVSVPKVSTFAKDNSLASQERHGTVVADYSEKLIAGDQSTSVTNSLEAKTADIQTTPAVIEDGVYAILSYSSMYRWMTIEDGSPWENANVQQRFSTTYPSSSFDRSSLFKISRVGSTDRYIVRLMTNNRLTISLQADGRVITKKIPQTDGGVSISDTFYFETDGAGYYLRPYGYAYVINLVSASTSNLSTVLKSSATLTAKWTLIKYAGTDQSGFTLYLPSSWRSIGIVDGSTSTATLIGWSTHINANTISVDIQSGYESLGTLSWRSSTNVMTFHATNPGQVRINGRIKKPFS